MTVTVTGLFDSYEGAARAVNDLETAGIPHENISIVSNDAAHAHHRGGGGTGTGATIGAVVGGGAGLLAGLGLLAIPGLGPVVAAGWLASTAVGLVAVGAAGGLIGALVDAGVSEEHAHVYAESIRRGGTLVSARVNDAQAGSARALLARHDAVDPEERGRSYRSAGWQRFEDTRDLETTDTNRTL